MATAVAVLLAAPAVLLYQHRTNSPSRTKTEGYVDPQTCSTCHSKIAQQYQQTGMGRSFRRVTSHADDADFLRANSVVHQASGKTYRMMPDGDRLIMSRQTVDPVDGTVSDYSQSIDYVVGSGNHSHTYLHRTTDNKLIELPVSWYSELGGYWAMSPGYDRPLQMDFRRAIGKECMFCHNGYPATDPIASNMTDGAVFAADLPEGIDCQRCHGPGAAHVRAAKAWRARPEEVAATILNPADLSRDRQLDVCRQCHLETTSLPLPNTLRRFGRGFYSFRPGEALTDYQLYFDHQSSSGFDDRLEVAHQAYRLEKSKCFLQSQMTCTTCHDPHMARRGEVAEKHYISICLGCHQSAHPDSGNKKGTAAGASNCLTCHMWKRRTDDVVHAVMTDHFIQRIKPKYDLLAPVAEIIPEYHEKVEPFYPRLLTELPAGSLYEALAQVVSDTNAKVGVQLLQHELEVQQPVQSGFYMALASAFVRLGKDAQSIVWFEKALKQTDSVPSDMREYAVALARIGQYPRAIEMAQQAVSATPGDTVALTNLSNIYLQSGDSRRAQEEAEKALSIRSDLADANNTLGLALVRQQKPSEGQSAFRRALKIDPDLAEARVNLASSMAERGDVDSAMRQMDAIIKANPNNTALYQKYAILLAGSKRFDEAIIKIKQAIQLKPQSSYLVDLGDLMVASGQVENALTYYRQAAKVDPSQARAHIGIASILMAQNNSTAAEKEYELAAAASPRNGEVQLALAEIAMRRGDAIAARSHLQAAVQSDDPNARNVAAKALGRP